MNEAALAPAGVRSLRYRPSGWTNALATPVACMAKVTRGYGIDITVLHGYGQMDGNCRASGWRWWT